MATNENGKPAPIGQVIESIPIDLDRPRSLRFDHHALMLAERELNKFREIAPAEWVSIEVMILQALRSDSMGQDVMLYLLWGGLLHEDPTLKPDTVSTWIWNRQYIVTKILEAIAAAWPRRKGDEGEGVDEEGTKERPLAPTAGSN